MAYDPYYQHYERSGYFFDRGLLTTYCLSLHTKPFVILSGISGTGKTKIAQLFNTAIAPLAKPAITSNGSVSIGSWIIMTVTKAFQNDGRANFRYSDLGALLDQSEIADILPQIEALKLAGSDDNICDPFDFIIETPEGDRLKAKAYLQRASSPLLRIRFKSKRGEDFYDSTGYFIKKYSVGTVLKLEKVGNKHLRIAAVDDAEVIQQARKIEAEDRTRIVNKCFVSVRPDWTDPTPLFGYYNLIDQKYHLTPVLRFILMAKEYPDVPFFLILDEMNLAKVEHYFSDFLSCLESRYRDGDVLKQEPIYLHAGSASVETNDDYFDLIASALELPGNLVVTGTVNIDESTYMFSPKVLDRANVIELNDVDIIGYSDRPREVDNSKFLLNALPPFTKCPLPSRADFQQLPDIARDFLIKVHGILAKHHLHFGYRVINEISRYLLTALEYCEPYDDLIHEALDYQIVQKVFPKLNGSQSKLEGVIQELLEFLVGGEDLVPGSTDSMGPGGHNAIRYSHSVEKLKRMQLNLALNGFANFIE